MFECNINARKGENVKSKKIALLTSGGDAPGMNAAIRSVTRAALHHGMEVIGIRHGYTGVFKRDFIKLDALSVSDIICKGGTILYTSRCEEMRTEEGIETAVKMCQDEGFDALVVIGGDGSFRGAAELAKRGVKCIGIPATIDNDFGGSEYSIGFDTACDTCIQMIDKLQDSMSAHDRCSVVEVMGRNSGNIALHAGIGTGATAILVPEVPFDFDKDVIGKINEAQKSNKNHYLIVVSEGVKVTKELAERIRKEKNIETTENVLGYVQRGGSPAIRDRLTASLMGEKAIRLIDEDVTDRIVVLQKGTIVDIDLLSSVNLKSMFNTEMYEVANKLSI